MRILFIITRSDTLGGAHVHVADMAAWLNKKGCKALVAVGGDGTYCKYLSRKGIEYVICEHLCRSVHLINDLKAIIKLRYLLRRINPDLVSLHSSKAGLLGRLASVGLNIPVLFTAHGWSFTEGVSKSQAVAYRMIERLAAPFADRIITVSEYDRNLALKAGICNKNKLVIVHNAMPDVSELANPGQSDKQVRIVMVARLDNQKDQRVLLLALSKMMDQNWILDLIGDGPREDELRAYAEQLGMADRVNFLGLREDVALLLACSHLFVLTTHWEGFPRSILEAMRAGLPVIATSVGGIPESVKENETGYLIPRNDVILLRERLAYLLDRPDERIRLGKAGRRYYEENFRLERMAEETVSIYQELLEKHTCTSV